MGALQNTCCNQSLKDSFEMQCLGLALCYEQYFLEKEKAEPDSFQTSLSPLTL